MKPTRRRDVRHAFALLILVSGSSFMPLSAHGQMQPGVPVSAVAFDQSRGDTTFSIEEAGEEIPGLKSGKTAFWWSFLGTTVTAAVGIVAPVVLVGALVAGPSLGHFYAGRSGTAWAGIGIRSLAGLVLFAGFALGSSENSANDSAAYATEVAVAGAVLGGASLVWDIARAPHSAHVHNDQLRQSHVSIGITPSMGATGVTLCAEVSF